MNSLRSGQLAKAANVNVETLRFYERRGLIPEPPREQSGYRLYPVESISRLRFIKGAQELGFTLGEIQDLLTLRVDETASKADVRKRSNEKIKQIEEKIATLELMRNALKHLVDKCHGDGPTSNCPILEAMESYTAKDPTDS